MRYISCSKSYRSTLNSNNRLWEMNIVPTQYFMRVHICSPTWHVTNREWKMRVASLRTIFLGTLIKTTLRRRYVSEGDLPRPVHLFRRRCLDLKERSPMGAPGVTANIRQEAVIYEAIAEWSHAACSRGRYELLRADNTCSPPAFCCFR